MVSLLEYRKRKQGGSRDPEPVGSSSSLGGTPTRPGSHYIQDTQHHHSHQQMYPPASSHSSFSSSAHKSISQIEEVSPPDQQGPSGQPRRQDSNNQWMVPTTVERLREGQGVLERVRRSIKMERNYKRSDGVSEKESDADRYEMQTVSMTSPTKSPHRYSPSVYSHQSSESHRQTESPSFLQQTSNSPFRGSYSPSSGQSFYQRLGSSHAGLTQDHPPSSHPSHIPIPTTTTSDSRLPTGFLHQQSGSSDVDGGQCYSTSHFRASPLNSSGLVASPTRGPRVQGQTKSGSPGQTALQAGSRLLSASGPMHYPQRGTSISQFQHSPLQGPGVRTQSGSF